LKGGIAMLKSVFLEVTRNCNLRCLFCSNNSSQPLSGELSTESFLKLVDDLDKMGIVDLRLYGGEPFLRKDVFEIIKVARSCGMEVSIYSNGTILNKNILHNLAKYQVRKLFLSVDSAVSKTHDYMRGIQGSFDCVIDNIKKFKDFGITVDVLLTICRLNKNDITATYRLLNSLGINDVKTNFVSKIGRAKEIWENISLTISEMRGCMQEINEIHQEIFGRTPVRKKCQAGTEELFIAANGDVYPCALFIEPEYLAGNINSKNICDIWREPNGLFATIREIVSQKQFCSGCDNLEICGGGCRARAAAMHNGLLTSPDTSSCIFNKEILK